MLYDPKWEKNTQVNQFTLESLIAWLEKQHPATRYDFCEFSECLLGRWLRSIDPKAYNLIGQGAKTGYFYSALGQTVDLTPFTDIAVGGGCHEHGSHILGAALWRARSELASQ